MEYVLSELDKIAIKVNPEDIETLKKAAITSIYSKSLGEYREKIAEIAAKAILKVAEKEIDEKGNVKYKVDLDNIKIEKRKGKSIEETELIDGIVLDKEVVHPGMPKLIRNAKIAVINAPLEIEKPEMSAKINITSPEQMKAFLDEETKVLQKMVEKIAASGANVLVCQKGIDDVAQYLLKKKGIMAVRRVKESDMEKVAKATGARIITNIDDLSPKDLGEAGLVEERIVAEEKMLFIEQCKNPKAVTILVRGASELIIDEAERSLHDALSVCRNVLQTGKLVAGGGSTEIELAIRARDFANKLSGKEQLAAQKFAEALEIVPIILAETSGLEPIDALVELRALHAKGETAYGVDALKGKIDDMVKLNILDPMNVKAQAIKAATEAAIMILRIDDIIAASPKKEEKKEEAQASA